jgi:hypothetical protein
VSIVPAVAGGWGTKGRSLPIKLSG